MHKRILIISGRKQSGKDTLGNFLLANHKELFGSESIVRKMGFADQLKRMVHELFGVPPKWSYGTDADKEQLTMVKWEDLPHTGECLVSGYMTVRELLQQFGTNIVRKMHPHAWLDALRRRIEVSEANLAVITDGRFPNEIVGPKEWPRLHNDWEVRAIRLRRNEDVPAEHESEWALDREHFDWGSFDAVIDNREMTKGQQNGELLRHLKVWGWWHEDHYWGIV